MLVFCVNLVEQVMSVCGIHSQSRKSLSHNRVTLNALINDCIMASAITSLTICEYAS